MDEELHALVYQAHPYRWPVIGWMGDIEAIRREDCEAYFRTYYAPEQRRALDCRATSSRSRLCRRIRKAYGDIPKGPRSRRW